MQITYKNAARQPFMPLMRALVRAYQAFASYDALLHRKAASGLTTSQADVIFTLGNTAGLSCSEIGERTLITKGTLTGVIDRLIAKRLVRRLQDAEDGRRTLVQLTAAGQRQFEREFPRQVRELKLRFDRMPAADRDKAVQLLEQIRQLFQE